MKSNKENVHRIDIRGNVCPYTFIKAKLALEEIGIDEVLEIHLDNKTALDNLPQAFMYNGQEYLGTESLNDSEWIIRIKRRK